MSLDVRELEEVARREEDSEVERMFRDDVRDKKITATGIHHRALRKKGFRGEVRFSYENMDKQAKKEYTKAGEVVVSNMYENLTTLMEFRRFTLLDKENRKETLEKYLDYHSIAEIAKFWGIEEQVLYNIRYRLGIKPVKAKEKSEVGEVMEQQSIYEVSAKPVQEEDMAIPQSNPQPVSQANDAMLSWEQVKELKKDEKKSVFENYYKKYGMKKLVEHWGVSHATIYGHAEKVGAVVKSRTIEKTPKAGKGKAQKEVVVAQAGENNAVELFLRMQSMLKENQTMMDQNRAMMEAVMQLMAKMQEEKSAKEQADSLENIFKISFNDTMLGDDISTQLLQIGNTILKDNIYTIRFELIKQNK